MKVAAYLHVWRGRGGANAGRFHAVFMLRLARCAAGRNENDDGAVLWAKQVDFINTLFCLDGERTLALRYYVKPKADNYAAGNVDVVLIGKSGGDDKETARASALEYLRDVVALMGGAMPDHVWEIVTEPEQFAQLWNPLPYEQIHVAEIRRRAGLIELGSTRPRPVLGRREAEAIDLHDGNEKVFIVYPFKPRGGVLTRLLRSLLLFRIPIVWQVTLSPAGLRAEEEQEMLRQIGKCEQYIAGKGPVGISRELAALNVRCVNMLCEMLVDQMVRLADAPYLLNISIASARRVPRMVVEAVGVEITHPVTGGGSPEGGYDVFFPESVDDIAIARINQRELRFEPWGHTPIESAFPRATMLVDALQAAGAFRLPFSAFDGLPGIEAQVARYRPMPHAIAEIAEGGAGRPRVLLGENRYLGLPQPVYLHEHDRHQHTYIIGQTGSGKTTLLKRMIVDDMEAGKGIAVIDPHGDLYEELLSEIPKSREGDVVLVNVADEDYPVGLNLLECSDPLHHHLVVREMKAIIERLLADQFGQKNSQGWAGPIFFQHMQMNMLLVMSNPDSPGTLLDFYEIFQHKDYWKKWVPLKGCCDPQLRRWVENTLPNTDYIARGTSNEATLGEYVSSKFVEFVFDPRLRRMFGQRRSTIDFADIMDSGKILLVNLSKGLLTEASARFLGMALLAKFQAVVMQRIGRNNAERRPFYLYVDEFQSLATENFSLLLSEARKFGVGLVLANQFLSQIKDAGIADSVLGNVGTLIAFRVGGEDAQVLEPQFRPYLDGFDLTNMPNWTAAVRTKADGHVVKPFSLNTVKVQTTAGGECATRKDVIARSRKQYASVRESVDMVIDRHY